MTYADRFDRAESGRLIVAPTKRPWVIKILVGVDLDSPQAKNEQTAYNVWCGFYESPVIIWSYCRGG